MHSETVPVPAPDLPSVLVVDDEPQVVWVLQFSLEAEGYTTYAASNGIEALSEIAQHRPAMMVLDIMMPGMDGWSLLEEMLKLPDDERPRVAIGPRPPSSAPMPTCRSRSTSRSCSRCCRASNAPRSRHPTPE
jgi:response regulator RpfG family c-di-GMP phosphodiesterase